MRGCIASVPMQLKNFSFSKKIFRIPLVIGVKVFYNVIGEIRMPCKPEMENAA